MRYAFFSLQNNNVHRLINLHDTDYVILVYFYWPQEYLLWFRNFSGNAQQNFTHSKQHHQNVKEGTEDNIKQCIS